MTRLALALLLAVALTAPAQETNAPRIVCDAALYEFGTVMNVEFIEHEFTLRNDGTADLVINRVRPTCGCTTAALSNSTIPPGGSVVVSARLSLAGRRGEQHKSIYVECNDPQNPQFRLDLVGTVRHEVDYRPQQAFLQRTPSQRAPGVEIQVQFYTDTPMHVTGIETNEAPSCNVSWRETTAGSEYTLTIQLRDDVELQTPYHTESVVVLTDHPTQPRLSIPVVIHQMRDVIIAPNQLSFVQPIPETPAQKQQLLVRNRTPEPLRILEVRVPTNTIEVSTQKLADAMYRVDLTFPTPASIVDGQLIVIRVQRQGAAEESYDVPIKVLQR